MSDDRSREIIPDDDPDDDITDEQHDDHHQTSVSPRAKVLAFWTIVLLVVVTLLGLHNGWWSPDNNSTPASTTTTSASPTTVTATSRDCSNGYPLSFKPEGTLPELQLLPDKEGSTHAIDTDADVRKALAENPRFLASFADWLSKRLKLSHKLWDDPSNWKPLATSDNKCLSDKGVEVLNDIHTTLKYRLDRVDENGEVSGDWTNMGLGSNGPVSNSRSGISGDRSAVVYYFKDENGNFVEAPVMKRCANLPTPTPAYPQVPPSSFTPPPPTTETLPPPPTTETTPPTTETTPPPPTTTPPPPWSKIPTPNPARPPGIVPLPLDPRDSLQPSRPTLAPGTTRQTTPIPTQAPIITTPRNTPAPPVPVELPRTTSAPTSVVIPRPPVPGSAPAEAVAPPSTPNPVSLPAATPNKPDGL